MKTYPGFVHANGNLICAIDIETTGTRPGYHEIIQVAVVPLDSDFKHSDIRPFYHNLQPQHPERASKQALSVNGLLLKDLIQYAPDPGKVADLLREWFEALDLPQSKKLMPLAHNWAFESAFLTDWLGEDERFALFHPHARDGMVLATAVNDLAACHGEKIPFQSISLESLCKKLLVENLAPHDALSDAVASAAVYRELLQTVGDFNL